MKLLEKLKNTFFEEEYVEVEEPAIKEQVVAKKIEPKETKKEVITESNDSDVVNQTNIHLDSNLVKNDSKLPYFEDDDFIDNDFTEVIKEEPKKIYGTTSDKLYSSINYSTSSSKPYSTQTKETFKPTPIISPIYGILDKNYHKDEVIDRKDKPASYVSRKNADLDSVRKKAYGNLDLFESEKGNVPLEVEEVVDDNLLYDMTTDNTTPSVDKVTIADAEEYFNDLGLEYNIDYKDSRYEKATGRRVHNDAKLDTDNSNNDVDSDDITNLDDNLFDLIDSMYEGGEE